MAFGTWDKNGFSLIQALIALGLTALLGLGITRYLHQHSRTVNATIKEESRKSQYESLQLLLNTEIENAAFINPRCNRPDEIRSGVLAACQNIPVMSGIQILRGSQTLDLSNLEGALALPHLERPATLAVRNSSSDAIRVWQELPEFRSRSRPCLISSNQANLNSTSRDSIYIDRANSTALCQPSTSQYQDATGNTQNFFEVGSFVLISEEIMGADAAPAGFQQAPQYTNLSFSHLAMITAIDESLPDVTQLRFQAVGHPLNSPHSIEDMGFSRRAQVVPLRMKELAFDATQRAIVSREATKIIGGIIQYSDWKSLQSEVTSFQIQASFLTWCVANGRPVLITPSGGDDAFLRSYQDASCTNGTTDLFIRHLSQMPILQIQIKDSAGTHQHQIRPLSKDWTVQRGAL